MLDGGAGTDTGVYVLNRTDYSVTIAGTDLTVVAKTGADGSDVLHGVERLHFADGDVAFDVEGNGGDIFRLYQAAFNRAPDLGGLGYWMTQRDHGMDMDTIARGFMQSDEYTKMYGTAPDDAAFLTHTYDNVLHRPYDQAGFDFWLGALHSGVSREDVLLNFANGFENRAQVIGSIENGFAFTPYA